MKKQTNDRVALSVKFIKKPDNKGAATNVKKTPNKEADKESVEEKKACKSTVLMESKTEAKVVEMKTENNNVLKVISTETLVLNETIQSQSVAENSKDKLPTNVIPQSPQIVNEDRPPSYSLLEPPTTPTQTKSMGMRATSAPTVSNLSINNRKFHSIEADLGIKSPTLPKSPNSGSFSPARSSQSYKKYPNNNWKAFPRSKITPNNQNQSKDIPECIRRLKEAGNAMTQWKTNFDAKKKLKMFLPEAFMDSNILESTLTRLYGKFNVRDVKIHYRKSGDRVGSGVMSVVEEYTNEVKNWAPNHPWKAFAMIPFLRGNRSDDSLIKIYLEFNSSWEEEQVEAFQAKLRRIYHLKDVEYFFDHRGHNMRSITATVRILDAENIENMLQFPSIPAKQHRTRLLEICDPSPFSTSQT